MLLLPILALAVNTQIPDLPELERRAARFKKAALRVDTAKLSSADQRALPKLLEAASLVGELFLEQMWSGNHRLRDELRKDKSKLGQARLHFFELNKAPWSALDEHTAFLPNVPVKKLPGSNFYPEDMSKDEFETWAAKLSKQDREQAMGFFTVIRRQAGKLAIVPYSAEYKRYLEPMAKLLREAAALTDNATLRKYLELRAAAFLSNDYYDSDVAWMELDAPIDITIGPYETYNDEILGYKAGFETYVTLRDDAGSNRLKFFSDHLQEIEDNLPIDPKFRNPKIGSSSPIRVVNEVMAAGDAAHGVRTAAFNLPNDDRVVLKYGSKRVMLKNIQEAKFEHTLIPISKRTLTKSAQADLSFDAFFAHILAHELVHGLGPQEGVRLALKETYSAIEEAKADITGLFMLQHLYDRGLAFAGDKQVAERKMYTTYLASSFRSMRFGLNEAHGKGMAVQFNYLLDKGAFKANKDGTFAIDYAKIKQAVIDLAHDILTIEATKDFAAASKMLRELGVMRPELQRAFDRLSDIPTDIEPVRQ